jgi:cell division protein FtsN
VAKRGASRGNKSSTPAILWLFTGLLIGLGLAWYGASKGWIAAPEAEPAGAETVSPRDETPLADEMKSGDEKPGKPQYDFFTVLPEMEVVVPEQQLSENKKAEDAAKAKALDSAQGNAQNGSAPLASDADNYILQVGSFRASADAEQMKARLALQGFAAQTQTVKVNDETWHRVRIGPVAGARKADEMRSQLSQAGIDSLVMKSP